MRDKTTTIVIDMKRILQCFFAILILVGITIPEGVFRINPVLGNIWKYYRWITCVVIIVFFFISLHNGFTFKISLFIQCIFFVFLLVVTVIKGSSLHECISTYLPLTCTVLLVKLYRDKIDILLNSVFAYLFFLALINLYYVLLYPDGMYKSLSILGYTKNWLMGYKSSFQFYLYPLFILSILNIKYRRRLSISFIAIFIILLQTLKAGNAMLTWVCLLVALLSFTPLRSIKMIYNPLVVVIVFAFINIMIVTFKFLNNEYIYSFITDVLHKSTTLSGRESIWATTLRQIKGSIVFGYGKVESHNRQAFLRGLSHSHNQILECLFQGGIIGTLIYCAILISSMKEIFKGILLKCSPILGLSLIGIMLMGTVEITMHQNDSFIWMLISLCSYVEEINYIYEGRYNDAKTAY